MGYPLLWINFHQNKLHYQVSLNELPSSLKYWELVIGAFRCMVPLILREMLFFVVETCCIIYFVVVCS